MQLQHGRIGLVAVERIDGFLRAVGTRGFSLVHRGKVQQVHSVGLVGLVP
jgi:hypothetical protein